MLPIINIHAHRKPSQREWVLRNAWLPANVTLPNTVGYFASVGVHPWRAYRHSSTQITERIKNLLMQPNVKAIGEIGLDRLNGPPLSLQKEIFDTQLYIAQERNLPAIIHCVRAYSDIQPFIKKYTVPFILHNYNGNTQTTEQLLRFPHVYFSFGKSFFLDHRSSLPQVPLNRFFFETDTMSVPITALYQKAANGLSIPIETLYLQSFQNFTHLFP